MTLFTVLPLLQTPGPLDSLLLAGEQLQADVAEAVTDAVLERTIEGVTTVTVTINDSARTLIRSELFRQRSVVTLDGNRFELVQVRKMGNQFAMTFEDVIVAELRRHKEPRTAVAGSTTRSAFVRRLVEEVHGTVVGPDSPQALLDGFSTDGSDTAAKLTGGLGGGLASTVGTSTSSPADTGAVVSIPGIGAVVAGGAPEAGSGGGSLDYLAGIWRLDFFNRHYATPEQIAQVAAGAGFSGDNLVTAVAVALAESGGDPNVVSKPNTDGSIDRGLWQINSVHSQYDHDQLLVPSYNAAAAFEISGSGTNFRPWTTFKNGAYKKHRDAATEGVDTVTATKTAAAPQVPVVQQTPMIATASDPKTKTPKDWWTSIKALADEVQWRVFCDLGVIWFAPDPWLIGQPPYLEISEDSPGVDWLDFDFDIGKPRSTMDLQAQASRWSIPPGVVIQVKDMGVGSGRWLVSKVTKSLFTSAITVELTQPQSQLPEPSHQPTPGQAAGLGTGLAASTSTPSRSPSSAARGRVQAMVEFALSKEGGEYVWGGDGPDNYDCSGLTHAAAASVDAFLARQTTAAWDQCGEAGTRIPVADGIATYGAVLWIRPPAGDHMAFSLGNGRTIEAMGTKWGIRKGDAHRFDHAALVPDLKDEYAP